MYDRLWNKNFIMILIGQIISLFGNTIVRFALNVYILDLTGSAAIFGFVSAISVIPTIVFSPVGGVIADRFNRKIIMVWLDFVSALVVGVTGIFFGIGDQIIIITITMVILSILQSFEGPAVQTSIPLVQTNGDNLIRGNAMVNQISMLANLVGPIIGGMLYAAFGIVPIIFVSALCFCMAAVIETFIQIPFEKIAMQGSVLNTIKSDFKESLRFIIKEKPEILKVVLVVCAFNLFLSSMVLIGISYFILSILEMGSEWYGIAEGAIGLGGIFGGLLAGLLAGKIKIQKLYVLLITMGISILPIAFAFLIDLMPFTIYMIITTCFVCITVQSSLFTIFAISVVQKQTPKHLLGKVYAFILTVCMIAHPIGQSFYGVLFDTFSDHLFFVLLGTSVITVLIGCLSKRIFARLESM